jgi:ABC-2 type transport system permease protein
VEEKASRVVEVVLSRVPAHRLLAGKVLGIGALGVIQVAVLAGAIYLAARRLLPAEALPALGWDLVLPVIAWFLIGFTFYAVIYAALGATVTRQEDLQGVGMIPVLLILPGYLIALMATGSPDALLVEVASFVPVTSPFVMPVRAAVAGIPAWEVAVSVAILLVTTWLTIRWAGRVYSGAILSIGQRVRLRDAWRGRSV